MAKRRPDRLTKLARAIESLTTRDAEHLRLAEEVGRARPMAAKALYDICRNFVNGVNSKLPAPAIALDPPEWHPTHYADDASNLIQINLRGRLLLLTFQATEQLRSSEDFKRPYILEGSVRSVNQELLDHNRMDEQQIFYCPKLKGGDWYYVDRRLYRTGLLNDDFLVRELERLL